MPADNKKNIADFIAESAALRGQNPAVIQPSGRDSSGRVKYVHFTYEQLHRDTDAIARGLLKTGLDRGDRCAIMVKPSLDFFAVMFACFKAGITPVMIDPGIGMRPLKKCLAEAEPKGFIGIPVAQAVRVVAGWARASIEVVVTVGRRSVFKGKTLDQVREMGRSNAPFPIVEPREDEIAAILFTSGGTGLPKGVIYLHRNFIEQVYMIRDMFGIKPGEIDLPTFPPFALFDPVLGMTALIPDMDARKPASVNPERLYEAMDDFCVTNMFGSPALLNTLSRDGVRRGKKLPSMRRVLSAGAPAQPAVLQRMHEMLAEGIEVFTPYGATECMPTCLIGSREVLDSRSITDAGGGVCVGRPFGDVSVSIIEITEKALPTYEEAIQLSTGEIGEIVVRGPTVTMGYFRRERATELSKMKDSEGRLYHRMGDVGYLDKEGRLWFCGRKSHRLMTKEGIRFTIPCEAVFNTHESVFRTALVGIGSREPVRPVLCVELEAPAASSEWQRIEKELREIGARFEHTRIINDFLVHPGFPVDIRHNAKIRREKLVPWATRRIK